MIENSDFYCCECKHHTVLYNRKNKNEVSWCDKQEKPVDTQGEGCQFFELEKDDKL